MRGWFQALEVFSVVRNTDDAQVDRYLNGESLRLKDKRKAGLLGKIAKH
jgi:hypothetical protein